MKETVRFIVDRFGMIVLAVTVVAALQFPGTLDGEKRAGAALAPYGAGAVSIDIHPDMKAQSAP